MQRSHDDPELTAYALGEPSVQDHPRLEDELLASEEARAWVDETRALAAILREGLAAEARRSPVPDLSARIAERLTEPTAVSGVRGPGLRDRILPLPSSPLGWAGWLVVGAAACLAVGTFVVPALWHSRREEVIVFARGESPPRTQTTATNPDTRITTTVDPNGAAPSDPRRSEALAPPPVSTANELAARSKSSATSEVAPAPVAVVAPEMVPVVPVPSDPSWTPPPLPRLAPSTGMSPELRTRYGLGGPVISQSSDAPASPSASARAGSEEAERRFRPMSSGAATPSRLQATAEPRTATGATTAGRSLSDASGTAARPETLRRYGLQPLADRLDTLELRPAPSDRYHPEGRRVPGDVADNPGYVDTGEHGFLPALDEPLSTFGLDVDTGSYANVRRFLNAGERPPRDAVRIEELINYFPYDSPHSGGDDVFKVGVEVGGCPWEPAHRLVRIAIEARGLEGRRPSANLVFLVDVSGSMAPAERLPLLQQALRALVKRMEASDRVAIVTYASGARVRLPSTSCEQKDRILEAIDGLEAGGSTHGEGGIRAAYEEASRHRIPGGVNRVLLCTDGDFNVGMSRQDDLVALIREKAASGVFLTTLGVGTDNFKDALMRRLADNGNGSYHYLDSFEEAQRVLVEQKDSTFVVVARDAKAQVEFNPARVGSWRLLGYEKRALAAADFADDTKDAGDVGAGQRVTVLYEIVPPGVSVASAVPELKYQRPAKTAKPAREVIPSQELMTLKLRHQRPGGSPSQLLEIPIMDTGRSWSGMSADFKFAASVASFGMLLKDSPHRGQASYSRVLEMAREGMGRDAGGWRAEFIGLVRKAQALSGQK